MGRIGTTNGYRLERRERDWLFRGRGEWIAFGISSNGRTKIGIEGVKDGRLEQEGLGFRRPLCQDFVCGVIVNVAIAAGKVGYEGCNFDPSIQARKDRCQLAHG